MTSLLIVGGESIGGGGFFITIGADGAGCGGDDGGR